MLFVVRFHHLNVPKASFVCIYMPAWLGAFFPRYVWMCVEGGGRRECVC